MIRHSFGLLGFGLLALSACSESDGAAVGRVSQPIINGTDSTSAQDAVVMIQIEATGPNAPPGSLCTGALIAPNLVLTARHCVSEGKGGLTCTQDGPPPGDTSSAPGPDFAASAFKVFTGTQNPPEGTTPRAKGKKVFHDDTTTLCGHDLALILLDASITDVPTIKFRTGGPVAAGEIATAVGWGVTEKDSPTPAVRKQRTGVKVEKVGPAPDDVPAGEFTVGEAICSGDSGGPLIADATGEVIGVVSRGGNNEPDDPNNIAKGCIGGTNYYQSLAPFKALIDSALAEANGTQSDAAAPSIPGDGGTSSGGAAASDPQDSGCAASSGSSGLGSPLALGLAAMILLGARRRRR